MIHHHEKQSWVCFLYHFIFVCLNEEGKRLAKVRKTVRLGYFTTTVWYIEAFIIRAFGLQWQLFRCPLVLSVPYCFSLCLVLLWLTGVLTVMTHNQNFPNRQICQPSNLSTLPQTYSAKQKWLSRTFAMWTGFPILASHAPPHPNW